MYDAVGNRTRYTQTITSTNVITYAYDAANRLTNVDGVAYTWDDNGNLLSDGSKTYTYTQANRLIAVSDQQSAFSFVYNGDGTRVKQVVDGHGITYTLDLAAPLVTVLAERSGATTTHYIYALGTRPLAQHDDEWEYLLPDALGSVRQLADADGNVTLSQAYQPYGSLLERAGSGTSTFGYAGEQADTSGLIYLRARYYSSSIGLFLAKDSWQGSSSRSLTLNQWIYVEGNPTNFTDPSGLVPYPNSDLQACVASQQLAGVDSDLQTDVCLMIAELEMQGYLTDTPDESHIRDGRRDPRDAHIYSTAYHILHNFISTDDLYYNRRDLDGNIWYRDEWDAFYCPTHNFWSLFVDHLVKANASELSEDTHLGGLISGYIFTPFGFIRDVSYAAEGYSWDDPFRLPNIPDPDVSKHVLGQAVDISNGISRRNDWLAQTGSGVDTIAEDFDLARPLNRTDYVSYTNTNVIQEWWHFERR